MCLCNSVTVQTEIYNNFMLRVIKGRPLKNVKLCFITEVIKEVVDNKTKISIRVTGKIVRIC